jgi:uncharacterized protein (DUF1800 family)
VTAATAEDVARLFGRAAFGATKTDLDLWVGKEYADVVDALFPPAGLPVPGALTDEARRTQLETATSDLLAAQRWWLERMRTTPFPLLERMTWFWHTHFANGYAGNPNVGDLMKQNQLIRANALGSFRTLLHKLTVDGAMLYYLSGYQNRRNAVNENYARELFELFTAGVTPQRYTENDIRQAAKALTGWVVKADRTVAFDTNRHDRSVKTICGTTIGGYPASDARETTEYQEVCDIALGLDTTAHFVAYKMVCSFAYVPDTTDLFAEPDPLVDAVAAALRPAWDITAAMKALLLHPRFRTGPALIRQPVEEAVHLAKVLTVNMDPVDGIQNTGASANNQPIFALRRMGQTPFQPPNVAGWPEGKAWLTSGTTIGRYSLGQYTINAYNSQSRANTNPMPASTADLAVWRAYVGLGAFGGVTQQQVQSYLSNPGTSDERTKQNGILFLLAASPDWQVM